MEAGNTKGNAMTTAKTIGARMAELAAEVSREFHRIKRNESTPGLSDGVWMRKSETRTADDWITNLCRAAHGEMFPDDWRYEFIVDALGDISETDDDAEDGDAARDYWNDRLLELFDGRYIYTAQQTGWLHSRADRCGYVDDWRKECGSDGETWRDLAGGMWLEYQEVFWPVFEAILAQAESDAEDDDADIDA